MSSLSLNTTVAIIGGGVVGAAILHALAHRGVDAVLLEAEPGLAYGASGTNSGVLHTGFDSTPGELETELIIRSAALRPAILRALGTPVIHTGAQLVPHRDEDHETIAGLAANAATNGVEVHVRTADGALVVPGESVTDPVAFTLGLASSAVAAGARVEVDSAVIRIDDLPDGLLLHLATGHSVTAQVVINAAGLHADDIARLIGDSSFEIYPRKGEFLVFELPGGRTLDTIQLPVPTKRTKGVLVFPTLDGRVVAGPTAVDLEDKDDWTVRPDARGDILSKAVEHVPALEGLTPVFSYAGLRPAGRNANYIIEPSSANPKLINVAAIRSTGLSASLGIAEYVVGLVERHGIEVGDSRPVSAGSFAPLERPWWMRTATLKNSIT